MGLNPTGITMIILLFVIIALVKAGKIINMDDDLDISLPEPVFPLIDWCSDCETYHKDNCKTCIVTKIQHDDTGENRWAD